MSLRHLASSLETVYPLRLASLSAQASCSADVYGASFGSWYYFLLSTGDLDLIRAKTEAHTQLGFALQLVTLRFLGALLDDPDDVPAGVKHYVARQVGVAAATDLPTYKQSKTCYRHAAEIKERFGYRDFSDPSVGLPLVRFLYTRATLGPERPIQLFDLATASLRASASVPTRPCGASLLSYPTKSSAKSL